MSSTSISSSAFSVNSHLSNQLVYHVKRNFSDCLLGIVVRLVLIFYKFCNFSLNFNSEPVGFKAPAFANDVKSISITRDENTSFDLSCRAQSYPAPSFRYFKVSSPFNEL